MGGILCEHCVAYCCRYIALPIDRPTTRKDFDDIRWYLLHEGISVFVEDGEWYISMETVCRHLRPDYRCGIYEQRPRICREYSTSGCDYHSGDYGWEQHFTCPEHLDEYVREHLGRNGKLRTRPKPRTKPGRPKLKAHLAPMRTHRQAEPSPYLQAAADVRGIPLPVLGARP